MSVKKQKYILNINIRILRARANLKGRDAAAALGVSYNLYRSIEYNNSKVTALVFFKICDYYKIKTAAKMRSLTNQIIK